MKNKMAFFCAGLMLVSLFGLLNVDPANAQNDGPTLDPSTIPKFVDQLVIPPCLCATLYL